MGGHWTLEDCEVDSTKRSRASSAVIVRNAATLDLRRCAVRDCAHAVVLERKTSTVHAERCSFTNVKEAFQTRGGGTVGLESNPRPSPKPNPTRTRTLTRWSSSTTPSCATRSPSSSTTR